MQKTLKNRGKTAYFTGRFVCSLVDRIYIIGCNLGRQNKEQFMEYVMVPVEDLELIKRILRLLSRRNYKLITPLVNELRSQVKGNYKVITVTEVN